MLGYFFRLDKEILMSKLESASNATIDERFYPKQTIYRKANVNQFMLNLGNHTTNIDTFPFHLNM